MVIQLAIMFFQLIGDYIFEEVDEGEEQVRG
jgi:hypothetical protein